MPHRLMTSCLIALSCWCLSPAPQALAQAGPDGPAADVYLLAGQSNMAGVGQSGELSPMWQAPIDGALIYRGGAFETLEAGDKGRFGPEIGFAHYLRHNQPGKPNVYLVKFALGGQPLDAGWDGGAADGSSWVSAEPGPNRKTFYPGTSADDPNTGLHYKKLLAHAQAAMRQLQADGYTPVLRGIVWMQGEQDAKNEVSADRYDKSLALLKQRIEEDLGAKPVPFVFGQVLPHEPAMDRFTHRELIRQRMAEADHRSGSARAIENVWMVSTDNMDLNKDTVHYSTKGLLELGQAFGVAMLTAHRDAASDD
ncbi:MAG: sialate O-acetylesterase [Phycisphaeraceae bacterium]